jgi:hypothetical protein
MKTFKSSGLTFKIVNEAPKQVWNRFISAVNGFKMTEDEDEIKIFNEVVRKLAGGACGRVFDLGFGSGFIMKANRDNGLGGGCKDGEIMEALQGLPLVPKIYAYSECNRFMLIQKIDGKALMNMYGDTKDIDLSNYNREELEKKIHAFYEGATERGWVPNDMHDGNSMVDKKGNFWVVDFGLFRKAPYHGDLYDLLNQAARLEQWSNIQKKGLDTTKPFWERETESAYTNTNYYSYVG